MFTKRSFKLFLLGMALFALLALIGHNQGLLADIVTPTPTFVGPLNSPLPTPPAGPTPPPVPTPSHQAQIALQYIAQREGIPLDDLLVAHEHPRSYSLLGRKFMALTIFDRATHRSFHLLVDPDDGSVVDDVATMEQAEAEAHYAKYGKLHPLLYERLQTAGDEESLPVAIWVGGERGRSRKELYATLANRYPEVQEALARHASPFDVGDRALSRQIRAEYERMRQEDIGARIQPLVTDLENRGAAVEPHFLLPSVTATLSKEEILALTGRDDVRTIYLIEGETEPELDTAVHTNHVAPVWSALGIDGLPEPTIPITIAILEQGNVDWDNSYLHHASIRRVSPNGERDHTTRVASDAASFHDTYRGMAPGATILSAGHHGPPSDVHSALNWALDQYADVVNMSEGFRNDTPDLEWIDMAFDYTARIRGATIIKSAGNHRDEYITAPGKGWNVVTVGGINDQGTTAWSDDTMYSVAGTEGSSYLDPGDGDREKPEVAAPGQDITAIGINDVPQTRSGTSHATPQVAGLAALLMHRNPDVKEYPTVVKAILMASAVHNIEGDSRLSNEDGAGSIDAALADAIIQTHQDDGVTCSGSCWWAIETEEDYPDPGDWLYQYFTASRGERIRVAIAWWSEADPPPAYPTMGDDALTSNFNLYVWSPSGGLPGYSASWDNNYEIVEFIAPETGIYEIGTFKDGDTTTEEENELGIAWVKDATYLPDLRNEDEDDWASELLVCNEGSQLRSWYDEPKDPVYIHYFESDGDPTSYGYDWCNLSPNQCCGIYVNDGDRIPYGTTGSAIVSGGEDVLVVVENGANSHTERTNYTGILPDGGSGSLG